MRRRLGTAGLSAAGLLVVVALTRMLRQGVALKPKHLQVLLKDLESNRVAHLEFGAGAIVVFLKAAAAAATTAAATPAAGAPAHSAYGVPMLPFLFQATKDKIAELMLEHGVTYSQKQSSLLERLQFLIVLLPFAYLVAMYVWEREKAVGRATHCGIACRCRHHYNQLDCTAQMLVQIDCSCCLARGS